MPAGLPGRLTRTDRPVLMGVVNVTPDSFSDGGRWATPEAAIAHGRELLVAGADILDVGGESTRPGATRPLVEEELARVVPVITALAADGATVSVDTMRSEVAQAAVEAGALIVNDVSGGLADPRMLETVAATGAAYVAMHWRAHSDTMQQHASYDGQGGVVAAVRDELAERVDAILAAGIDRDSVVLDPGLGFAKTAEHNWALLRGLGQISSLGFPVLVGASRKSFLGSLLAGSDGVARGVEDREHAASALHVLLAQEGVWGLRTHDVRAAHDALRALARWNETGAHPMTDELTVTGIECYGYHGVFEHEKRDGQTFVVDLTLGLDTTAAAASDDLRDTVDYGSLVAAVKQAVEADPVDLIETLAQRLADVCLRDGRVEWVRITVHKPGAPIEATFGDVTLTITRARPSS